jgi:HD superfamily phosphohydrolase
MPVKKKVIFNDPIYGFIHSPNKIVLDLIENPYFQRLRRIKQLGLTHLVYPGAYHTRFQHAMGAMHLMTQAIEVLKSKGVLISEEEATAVTIAILLHDIGHGPFSHALENSIVHNVTHEDISELFMQRLNDHHGGSLDLAIKVFKNRYKRKFFHQLVSGQLDIDRLDYLKRDSFFSGVAEGVISSDRIIKMLNVHKGQLVVDAKGIYSVEKFLIARRLMYWQVYLHKTVIAAEFLLIKILMRAKYLAQRKEVLFGTPALLFFLNNKVDKNAFSANSNVLDTFSNLDDYDIFSAIKVWADNDDNVLSRLCKSLVDRDLFKVEIQENPFSAKHIASIKQKVQSHYQLKANELSYFVFTDSIKNSAYQIGENKISILNKNGTVMDVAKASDHLNLTVLSKTVTKHVLCYPKSLC